MRRSEIVHSVSVFVSHLQYIVRPHDGNYDTSQYVRRTLRRILDRVFSPHPVPLPSGVPTDAVAADWTGGEPIFLDNGTELLSWIDGLDQNTSKVGYG